MTTELYWIPGPWPGRLAVSPRPRGGDWLDDEVRSWRRAGVDIVLSLLTADEANDLDLTDERRLCEANGIQYLSLPVTDRSVPASREAVFDLLADLADELAAGKSVVVHCRQGVGRAAMIAICLLVLSGSDLPVAIEQVGAARGCSVPETPEQRRWVAEFAASLPPVSRSMLVSTACPLDR